MLLRREIFLLAASLFAAAPANAQTKTYTGPGNLFSLELPEGCAVTSRPNLPDFALYDVMCNGVGYAGIYVGRFPQSNPNARIFRIGPTQVQIWANHVPIDQ